MNNTWDSADIDTAKRELLAAGWVAKTPTIWRSPTGQLHLGPAGAWKVMKREQNDGRAGVHAPQPAQEQESTRETRSPDGDGPINSHGVRKVADCGGGTLPSLASQSRAGFESRPSLSNNDDDGEQSRTENESNRELTEPAESHPPSSGVGTAPPEPPCILVDRDADVRRELRAYLDGLTITSDNIGEIRRSLLMPFDWQWNGWVREDTADRENKSAARLVPDGAPKP